MPRERIGAGWERNFGKDNERTCILGQLDLGVLGDVPFAVFPNDGRIEERKQPTHNIVVTVTDPEVDDEKRRIALGGAWERTSRDGNSTYFFVKLNLDRLGTAGVPGVDLSGMAEPVYARMVRVKKDGERSPDMVLLRARPEPQNAEAATGGQEPEAEAVAAQ